MGEALHFWACLGSSAYIQCHTNCCLNPRVLEARSRFRVLDPNRNLFTWFLPLWMMDSLKNKLLLSQGDLCSLWHNHRIKHSKKARHKTKTIQANVPVSRVEEDDSQAAFSLHLCAFSSGRWFNSPTERGILCMWITWRVTASSSPDHWELPETATKASRRGSRGLDIREWMLHGHSSVGSPMGIDPHGGVARSSALRKSHSNIFNTKCMIRFRLANLFSPDQRTTKQNLRMHCLCESLTRTMIPSSYLARTGSPKDCVLFSTPKSHAQDIFSLVYSPAILWCQCTNG